MKAKKPLVLAVLILALVAVALIVPATASGKPDALNPKQALNWVSHGEDSNGAMHHLVLFPGASEMWLRAGHSVLVKQMSDGTLVGNGVFHILFKPEKWQTIHTKDVDGHEPVFQNDVTYTSFLRMNDSDPTNPTQGVVIEYAKVAMFYMDFGDEGLMKLVLVDGGEPKTCDYEKGENVAFGNIQIHYGGEPIIE